MTYARHVFKAFEKDILPLLQKQNGFTDLITFVSPDAKSCIAISLWERKEDADAFGREIYPQALKQLAKGFEGTPELGGYEVATSTFPKATATH